MPRAHHSGSRGDGAFVACSVATKKVWPSGAPHVTRTKRVSPGGVTLRLQLERFERRDKKLVASSGAKVAGYVAGYVELEIEIVRN